MAQRGRPFTSDSSGLAIETAANRRSGDVITAGVSAIALLFSGYSLYDSSFKSPDVQLYVPATIKYASPYQNSNFEVFAVPVTMINDGGRTGTILSMQLAVTNQKTKATKRFYAADLGQWTMEQARKNDYQPFAPISLTGKQSRTETILFHPLSPEEKPEQVVETEPGKFSFTLTAEEASAKSLGLKGAAPSVSFDMELRYYDARAFNVSTLPMFSFNGKSASSTDAAAAVKADETKPAEAKPDEAKPAEPPKAEEPKP
jgi:hypothetical protein